MKKVTPIFLIFLVLFITTSALSQENEPDVKAEMEAQKVIIEEKVVDGETIKEETYEAAEKAFPGDLVQYNLKYWNDGTGPANDLKINGPIPYNTKYIPESAKELDIANIQFSIDRFFKVTDNTFAKLKEQGISESIISSLEEIKNREYDSEKDFVSALKFNLGDQLTNQIKMSILNFSVDNQRPKNYETPPITYKVTETDENGEEKVVEKTATPDMYTSIQWSLQDSLNPDEEITLSYRVKIK